MKKQLTIVFALCLFALACSKEQDNTNKQVSEVSSSSSVEKTTSIPAGFGLNIKDQSITSGETFCLDIEAMNFKNIVSMQYSLRWDPNQLKFIRLDSFALKALSVKNFNINRADKGVLIKSWFDPMIQGINKADGTSIYQVCFETIGETGQTSFIQFSSVPTVIEISDPSGEIDFTSNKTTISIQ